MKASENMIGLAKLLRVDRRSVDAVLALGRSDLARNRVDDANAVLEMATQLTPDDPRAWRLRAKALRKSGNEDFARAMENLAQKLEERR